MKQLAVFALLVLLAACAPAQNTDPAPVHAYDLLYSVKTTHCTNASVTYVNASGGHERQSSVNTTNYGWWFGIRNAEPGQVYVITASGRCSRDGAVTEVVIYRDRRAVQTARSVGPFALATVSYFEPLF